MKFYSGYIPSLFLSFHGVIQMYSYENVNYIFGFTSGTKLSWDNFFIPFLTGGVAKSLASATMMPFNVVRLRM